jgi:hypothetical protein
VVLSIVASRSWPIH